MKKIFEIAMAVGMINSERFVYIRGYTRKVKVSHKNRTTGEWIVRTSAGTESVPEHCFYHRSPGGLIPRDGVEFKRNYPKHPVEIEHLPG